MSAAESAVADAGPDQAARPSLAQRLEALEASGAPRFDAAAYAEIAGLLARSRSLAGIAGARLADRAERRASLLEARLAAARADVTDLVHARNLAAHAATAAAMAQGDFTRLRRAARRRPVVPDPARIARDRAWYARLAEDARARDVEPRPAAAPAPSPSPSQDPADADVRAAIADLVRALYDRSLDEAAAACALARATDAVPSASGPYNALALATRALGELGELSPAYLRAQLARFEDLGALLALPPVVSGAPSSPRRAARRGRRD